MTAFPGLTAGTWTVDPTHAEVGFVARHLMVAKVRGRFTEVSGTVEVGETLAETSVRAVASAASVSTNQADRDGHLRSADFFDVETYPELTFVSTSVSSDSMIGDLTIKGVTRSVTFDLEFDGVQADPWGNTKAGFTATTAINRSDWGLTWNAAIEGGGVLVSDKIAITLEVELLKG
ncbi:MAG: YceI family protein [Actinomycetales bacterium]|jgi:polyisoprenoid-binding protein YceI|uniref:YceI family protein n=1 Tax=Candidatus Phosphoribacter hodrii TaxID=2953743 RepID=A0A935MAA6_9MICO|nr:YceI family protein [Candidatus Phosphoribacter hodrii]MBK7273538.1 YceI family protein [Candidatus Phosphoribacter hodrii]HOF37350.1 YceI family protein [Dermatophilaceae bacterium]HOR16418.1 YceI family protein [Dermatophilaceae bacterium]HPK90115.1 YceI family protein [Dermatophilaceae bacterium]